VELDRKISNCSLPRVFSEFVWDFLHLGSDADRSYATTSSSMQMKNLHQRPAGENVNRMSPNSPSNFFRGIKLSMTSSKISQRIKPEFIDTSLYRNANQCWDVDKSIGNWKNSNFPLSNAISGRLRRTRSLTDMLNWRVRGLDRIWGTYWRFSPDLSYDAESSCIQLQFRVCRWRISIIGCKLELMRSEREIWRTLNRILLLVPNQTQIASKSLTRKFLSNNKLLIAFSCDNVACRMHLHITIKNF
jgi:hypothetical protein